MSSFDNLNRMYMSAEVFIQELIWPTSFEFDESGNVNVAEAGYLYGDIFVPAQIFRITPDAKRICT